VVLRDKDANTSWTSASDGTLEERIFYCQNWRADVVALVDSNGQMLEWVKYSAYGVPFGLPGGDTDSDGDCDATDVTQVQTWIDAPAYDVRGDIDIDGDVDAADKSTIQNSFSGLSLGRAVLSSDYVRSMKGLQGSWLERGKLYAIRQRPFDAGLGRWLQRDPLGYVEGTSLYASFVASPMDFRDPSGTLSFGSPFSGPGFGAAVMGAVARVILDEWQDCCQAAVPLNPNDGGLWACCNGVPVPCNLASGGTIVPGGGGSKGPYGGGKIAQEAINDCIDQHEMDHIGDTDKNGCKGKPNGTKAPWDKGKYPTKKAENDRERALGSDEQDCLETASNNCPDMECATAITKRLDELEQWINGLNP
jgi:RHS repeat-associated protein